MAIQFNPSSIGSGLGYASQINNLFSTLSTALEDAVSRSGYGANAMSADLDLGDNDLLNVGRVDASELYLDGAPAGVDLPSIQAGDADKLLVVKDDESGFELLADLPANSVPTAAIEDGAVTTSKINNGDITAVKLASTAYATQAQAEAGTNSEKLMTPERTDQYVDARLATQAEAEAGANSTQLMTPERIKQYAAANLPRTLVYEEDITSTANVDLVEILDNFGNYSFLDVVFYLQVDSTSGSPDLRMRHLVSTTPQTSADYHSTYKAVVAGSASTESTEPSSSYVTVGKMGTLSDSYGYCKGVLRFNAARTYSGEVVGEVPATSELPVLIDSFGHNAGSLLDGIRFYWSDGSSTRTGWVQVYGVVA